MIRQTANVIAISIVLFASSTAQADFNYTGQTRWVYGELSGALAPTISQTINAPNNFNLFDATTSLTHPTYGGLANQHQRSELLPGSISITGDILAAPPSEVGTGIAETETYTSVTFSLSTATDVALAASGTVFGHCPLGTAKRLPYRPQHIDPVGSL